MTKTTITYNTIIMDEHETTAVITITGTDWEEIQAKCKTILENIEDYDVINIEEEEQFLEISIDVVIDFEYGTMAQEKKGFNKTVRSK